MKYPAMKTYWGGGNTVPCILNLGTRWKLVVSFTSQPLYSQGKEPPSLTHWIRSLVVHKASLEICLETDHEYHKDIRKLLLIVEKNV
jgi:hypothetical protein